MCHPGIVDKDLAAVDPVTTPREDEYRYLAGEISRPTSPAPNVTIARFRGRGRAMNVIRFALNRNSRRAARPRSRPAPAPAGTPPRCTWRGRRIGAGGGSRKKRRRQPAQRRKEKPVARGGAQQGRDIVDGAGVRRNHVGDDHGPVAAQDAADRSQRRVELRALQILDHRIDDDEVDRGRRQRCKLRLVEDRDGRLPCEPRRAGGPRLPARRRTDRAARPVPRRGPRRTRRRNHSRARRAWAAAAARRAGRRRPGGSGPRGAGH